MTGGDCGGVSFASRSYNSATGHGTEKEPAHWRDSCKLLGACVGHWKDLELLSEVVSLGLQSEPSGLGQPIDSVEDFEWDILYKAYHTLECDECQRLALDSGQREM